MNADDSTDRFPALRLSPDTSRALFIAANASIMGDVRFGSDSSCFYHAVLRADLAPIRIGRETNIQDGVIIHVADDRPTMVGDRVTVGHRAILHACTVADEALIGMGSTVLDEVVIPRHCIVGANSLVTRSLKAEPGSLIVGSPARAVRFLQSNEITEILKLAEKYQAVARAHHTLPQK